MSEFTDCIYLRADSHRVGIDWLKRHGLRGYVMRASDGWCQVLPEWPFDSDRVRDALRGTTELLVHFQFASDHRWAFAIYVADTQAFRYACSWDPQKSFDVEGSLEFASRRLGVSKEALDDILYTGDPRATHRDLIDSAARFCSLIGIRNHSWAAFRYVTEAGPAMLVQPKARGEGANAATNLAGLSGVLAKLSISQLAQDKKIVFDPDSRHIRQNLARHLVEELDAAAAPDLTEIATSWHRAMLLSPMIARFRFEPYELEQVLAHLVSQAGHSTVSSQWF